MSGFSANFSNLPPGCSVNDIEDWQEDPDLERKARYEDPFWNTAPLSEAEAYDLLQEELTGITAEDLEPEPTQEERDLDRWRNSDPESFYGYLPRSAK